MRKPDPFYSSLAWRVLRKARLERDRYACVACRAPARTVDHIQSRRSGGADQLSNLRSLCAQCDNRIKEGSDGRRRNGGRMGVIGPDGWPVDS